MPYRFSHFNKIILRPGERIQKGQQALLIFKNALANTDLKRIKLLDLGSSSGVITDLLAGEFGEVVGIDTDSEAIAMANKTYKKQNLKFITMDASDLLFKDNSFDVILAHQIYYLIPDQSKFFSEIHRVLKPGGIVLLASVNKFWPFKNVRHVKTYFKTYWELIKMTKKFEVSKVTPYIAYDRLRGSVPLSILKIVEPFMPNLIWLLKKPEK